MKLCITSGQHNESKYAPEWIAWYALQGVEKFVVYNHDSTDNTEEIYKRLKAGFDIDVYRITGNNCHYPMQQHFLDTYRKDYDWLLCHVDPDEYMWAMDGRTIKEVLADYQEHDISALGVYWTFFGDSGHVKDPAGPTIKEYTHRSVLDHPLNHHMKSIVRGRGRGGSIQATNPHVYTTEFGTYDLEGRIILPHQGLNTDNPNSTSIMRINHYWARSFEWFEKVKVPRGYRWDRPATDPSSNVSYEFWKSQNFNDEPDTEIWDLWGQRYLEKLTEVYDILGDLKPNLFDQ